MRIYQNINVLDAAKERIEYLFDEFEQVAVAFSGGKDSTTVLELTLDVARRRGRLPVPLIFIDQEIEWGATIDYVRKTMHRDEVEPMWVQVPIRMSNDASHEENYMMSWGVGEDWMRNKEPDSIQKVGFPNKGFYSMFQQFLNWKFDSRVAMIAGIRCEESPTRSTALTTGQTYKHITWGKKQNESKGQYGFYPIYDWTYYDVWKYIGENDFDYCEVYNYMHKLGVSPMSMRVSSLHHATAIKNLLLLQESEPETWNKVVKRLDGVNAIKHLSKASMQCPKELPSMFKSWIEYRDYLVENLIFDEDLKERMVSKFKLMDEQMEGAYKIEVMHKVQCRCAIIGDKDLVLPSNFMAQPTVTTFRKWKDKGTQPKFKNKFIHK